MRIIGGTHRGRTINPPNNLPIRPTTDKSKEALFNILTNEIDMETLSVLDLFAGIGNISLEFASRGAKNVLAIDTNVRCLQFVKETAQMLDLRQIITQKADVFKLIAKPNTNTPFDLIFADAPYHHSELRTIPNQIFENKWLAQNGWLIVEHPATTQFDAQATQCLFDQRRYGHSMFSFFAKSK